MTFGLRLIAVLVWLASLGFGQFFSELRPHPHPLPRPTSRLLPVVLDHHQVTAELSDGLAKTKVRLVFRNPNGIILEGTFLFPIPAEAAVNNFAMLMGGKMVEGEVLERDKAAGIYQSIVQRQRDPALLEYVGRSLFQAKVFPIPASGTTEIELSYTEPLRRDGRNFEYRCPLKTRSQTQSAVLTTSISVQLKSSDPMLTIYSPSHEIHLVKKGDHEAKVSYERGNDSADRDFVLVYGISKESVGASLFSHAEQGADGAFLLLLAPSDDRAKTTLIKKDVVFVVDTSGSMAGEKMEQARKALRFCINSLNPEDRFNVLSFATEVTSKWDALAIADASTKKMALEHVEGLRAVGGTNIRDALTSALALSKDKERPFQVVFITDGEPTIGVTSTDAILADVKKANQALTRLFVFGVGEQLRVDLLDLLAEQNYGARDYVSSREDIEVRISSFFEKVGSPVMSDVTVSIDGVRVSEVHPKNVPDLFRGSQLLLTGRYSGHGPAVVRVKGKVNGEPVELVHEVEFKRGNESTSYVPRLWAVRRVGYLMDQIRLNGESVELKSEVIRLGKTYGIVTPYTSYLVVEDDVAAGRPGGGGGGFGGDRRRSGEVGEGFGPGRGRGGGATPPPVGRSSLGGSAEGAKPGSDSAPGASKAPATRASAPTPSPSDAVESEESGKKIDALRALDKGKNEEKSRADRDQASDAFRRDFLGDNIEVSKAVKKLKESRGEGDGVGDALIKRVENRTFLNRSGMLIELSVLDWSEAEIAKNLFRVTAFSPEYFALLKEKPELSKILALGESVLFVDGKRLVQILPAPAVDPDAPK